VVLVQVARVDRVVHAVERGGVDDPLEEAEPGDELRVDPELVERGQAEDHREGEEGHAEQRERQVERQHGEPGRDRLPQRDREVVVLAVVVNHVSGPENVHLVGEPVPPVVGELHAEQRRHPGQPGGGNGEQPVLVEPLVGGGEHRGADEEAHQLLSDPAAHVRHRVAGPVDGEALRFRHRQLDADAHEEERNGQGDEVGSHGASLFRSTPRRVGGRCSRPGRALPIRASGWRRGRAGGADRD